MSQSSRKNNPKPKSGKGDPIETPEDPPMKPRKKVKSIFTDSDNLFIQRTKEALAELEAKIRGPAPAPVRRERDR